MKFFEPYLFVIYLNLGLNLFEIGILIAITELFAYLFEIPSGILADSYGKKRILISCFTFYILSFVLYFSSIDLYKVNSTIGITGLIFASLFFGLGEAFRSGTHKAMELMWMEKEHLADYKSYVYGLTRSYSLIGASLSSIIAIIIALTLRTRTNIIFLFSVIPYSLDLLLIKSYPNYMNKPKENIEKNVFKEIYKGFKEIGPALKIKKVRNALVTSSSFDAIFKSLKDYIQPLVLSFGMFYIFSNFETLFTEDDIKTIILGILYAIFYILSSISSKNSFRAEKVFKSSKNAIDYLWDIFAVFLILEAICIYLNQALLIILGFLAFYILENLRRPIVVGYIGDNAENTQRATILSVESQFKSIFKMIFAPIFGFIATQFNVATLFIFLGMVLLILNRFLGCKCVKENQESD